MPLSFEPLSCASGQQFRNRAMTWNASVRSNFQKRLQNEGPLMHARVRQDQAGIIAFQIIINQEIQIQRSWRICILSYASVPTLNFEQGFKQIMG